MTEIVSLLEKSFDLAFDSPNGIKELRNLILKLAMMGKLVPQDKNDQPASELLKEIEAEKEKLIAEGKIKKQKPLPEIKPEEVPYELPEGWVWCRLGEITKITGGFAYKSNNFVENSRCQVIRLGNIRPDYLRLSSNPVYISQDYADKTLDYKIKCNDILITMTGTRLKKDYLYSTMISKNDLVSNDLYLNQRVGLIRAYSYPDFINLAISDECFKETIYTTSTGSANQANIGMFALQNWILPLPPLNEQKRIVAKINDLMVRCDEMERLKKEQQEKQLKINKSALHQLMETSNKSSFSSAFNFITNNFSSLYGVKENVDELKKSILQLAMMGKLVPQDKNDQPASELLKEIKVEKEKLVAEGKIKKQKPLPEIKAEEVPYKMPEGWVWCRINDIGTVRGGKRIPKGHTYSNSVTNHRYLTVTNMKNRTIVDNNVKYISKETKEIIKNYFITSDDIYITIAGTIGEVGTIPQKYSGMQLTENAARLIFSKIEKSFFVFLLSSVVVQGQFAELTNKMAQPKLSLRSILSTFIPLPPLNEQKRIVAKINELMALCDEMIGKIECSEQAQEKLLDSVLAKV